MVHVSYTIFVIPEVESVDHIVKAPPEVTCLTTDLSSSVFMAAWRWQIFSRTLKASLSITVLEN